MEDARLMIGGAAQEDRKVSRAGAATPGTITGRSSRRDLREGKNERRSQGCTGVFVATGAVALVDRPDVGASPIGSGLLTTFPKILL
jgi:hypothetical protein